MPDVQAPALTIGQRVRVHVNLHLQRLAVADPASGKVLGYVQSITLDGVTFRTQEACLDRVQATGVRKVCAYAVGKVAAVDYPPTPGAPVVTFNPHRARTFHYASTGEPLEHARRVTFADLRAYVDAR